MDHWNILDYEEEARTPILEKMKQKLIRGEIIMKYTLIDEFLSVSESESEWLYYIIDTLRKGQANLLMRSCTEAM
jgi:hypothetical protein